MGNFAACGITLPDPFDGSPVTYPTVEHYFQASKASTGAEHKRVAGAPSARAAKRLGRKVKLRADWEEIKEEVMETALREKFRQKRFAALLLATGDKEIAEDSPHDFEWGARDPSGGWSGENKLGRLLMKVREELQAGRLDVYEPENTQLSLGQEPL